MSAGANQAPILTGSGSWRGGGLRTSRVVDSPAIKEVLYPSNKGNGDFFIPRSTQNMPSRVNLPSAVVPRRVYTRSFTTPASVAQVLPSRPQRRVTFDLPPYSSPRSGANFCEDYELDIAHNNCNSNTAGIPSSVCEVAGVASWLKSRRHLNNKESFKIKNINSTTSNNNNNNNIFYNNNLNRRYSSVIYSGNGTSGSAGSGYNSQVRRVSAAAAIDASKLPPTVGPVAAGPSGPGPAPCTAAGLALLRACREGDEEGLQDLMSGKVAHLNLQPNDVNCSDASGRTPVSFVASSGSLSMLEALARFPNVDFNRSDNEGNTALHFAAQAGHVEVLNLLLSRCAGVEVDARNLLGFTPLMKAALQGRTKCAKLLLFAGASPSLRDLGRGFRAEQWARYCGRHVCAEVIDKFSRHRLLERAAAAHVNSGRWGSEPELSSQPIPQQAPQQPQHSSGGGSWLRSKLRRAFRSNADSPSSKSKHHGDFSVTSQIGPVACATSTVLPSPSSTPPPQTPRVFIVPKVQVTPAGDSPTNPNTTIIEPASESCSQARPVVTSNARRKK